jgi:hypothetical protein
MGASHLLRSYRVSSKVVERPLPALGLRGWCDAPTCQKVSRVCTRIGTPPPVASRKGSLQSSSLSESSFELLPSGYTHIRHLKEYKRI